MRKPTIMNCLNGCGAMTVYSEIQELEVMGTKIEVEVEGFRCDICGLECGSIEQAGSLQERITKALDAHSLA